MLEVLASPLLNLSNAFSGIFGSNNYSSTNQLLGVQMKMLDNISSKLDVVHESLLLVLENQEQYKEVLKAIPSETVQELFKKNLEGLFIILREKIEAYIFEKENNTLNSQKTKLIFDEILRELQMARGRIMTLDVSSYLILPVVTTCLHFEIFCMVLAKQPKSYINVVLRSYQKWINLCLYESNEDNKSSKLKQDFKSQKATQEALISNSKLIFAYTHSKFVESREYIFVAPATKENPEPPEVIRHREYFDIYFKKHYYKFANNWTQNQNEDVSNLLSTGLINNNEVYTRLEFDKTKIEELPVFTFARVNGNDIQPTKLPNSNEINKSTNELKLSINRTDENAENNLPVIGNDAIILGTKITNEGYKLIMYASIIHTGNVALNAINKFLAEPNELSESSITEFALKYENITRINNERVNAWVKYIQDKIDLVEDAESRAKIMVLKEKMQNLKINSKNILQEYSELEKEIANEMPNNLLSGILEILRPIGKELEIGVQNILREHEKFVEDLARNVEKAVQDVSRELDVAGQNVGSAVEAAGGFVENQFQSYGEIITDTEKRIREGKIIDALWHIGTDHLKHTENNAAIAFMESSLLTSIASSAASIYGGPAGGAAFSAWLTYKQTGDLGLALKVATITYFTQKSLSGAKTITGTDVTDIAKRTLVTSAIGAASIAASGGSEKDIIDGFLKGAALNLANDYYKSYMNSNINDEISTEDALDKNYDDIKNKYGILTDKNGKPILVKIINEKGMKEWVTQIDPSKVPANISQLGISSVETGFFSGSEHSWPMQKLAKIPGMNAMARFHDQWCAVNQVEGIATQVTIIPAIALTIAGRNQILIDNILEELNKNDEE